MSRRLIIAVSLVAAVGGGAGVASAASPVQSGQHELCLVLAKDPAHSHTQDFCINYWGIPAPGN